MFKRVLISAWLLVQFDPQSDVKTVLASISQAWGGDWRCWCCVCDDGVGRNLVGSKVSAVDAVEVEMVAVVVVVVVVVVAVAVDNNN